MDPFDPLPDQLVIARTAEVVAIPRRDPADSFVLHAPLEIVARAGLLPYVAPDARPEARRRIAEIGTRFTAFGPPTEAIAPAEFNTDTAAAAALAAAVEDSDLAAVDRAAHWLGEHAGPQRLRHLLAGTVIPSLAAAGHAPILLWLLPRIAGRGQIPGRLLRPLARELGRNPDWRLRWFDAVEPGADTSAGAMIEALAETPLLGPGASNFIHPTMNRIDTAALAGAHLGPVCGPEREPGDLAARGRAIMRVAAWSMLGEPTTHAPYGWSHALTMSQAVVGIADACPVPERALAVAATYVMGFRASLATAPLLQSYSPLRSSAPRSIADALAAGADDAATAAWHADASDHDMLVTELATRAATHPDAHLVKYTLACFDAAAMDPEAARLYLAAAAKLVGYWSTIDTDQA